MPHRIFQRHLFASTSLHSGNRKWLGFGTVGFAAVTAGYWYWQTKKQEAYPQTVQEPLRKALIQRHRQAEPSRILHYFNEAIQASLNMDSSSRARTALWVEVGDYYRDLASQTNVVQRKNQLLGKTVQLYHGAWKGNAEALMSKGTKDSNDDDDILERSVVTAMKLGQALEQSQGDNEAEKMYEWAIQAVLQRVINSDDGLKRYIEVLLPCLDAMVQLFKKQKRFALAKETLSEMWEIVKNETSENCRSSSIAIEAAAVESELRNFSDAKNWYAACGYSHYHNYVIISYSFHLFLYYT
jgi:hypothetical protein